MRPPVTDGRRESGFADMYARHRARHRSAPPTPAPPLCTSGAGERCPVCLAPLLRYEDEIRIKQEAFAEFWAGIAPDCPPAALVTAPPGRHYRTVSRRKVFTQRRSYALALIDAAHHRPFVPASCAIEPPAHARIYQAIERGINAPSARALADELRYAIIRRNGKNWTVILNVRTLAPGIHRPANTLSRSLTRACPDVSAVFLLEGGEEERYYLGGAGPLVPRRFRKLFGDGTVSLRIRNHLFRFSPLSFSQVNGLLLGAFLDTAENLLAPRGDASLLDLYCGYGLFALAFSPAFRRVTGVELSPLSIASARENAQAMRRDNVRFIRSAIDGETIGTLVRLLAPDASVILDPPRAGTAPGVIEQIAACRPGTVLHVFCNMEVLRRDVGRWLAGGYRAVRVVPLDMFPGTDDLEVMVLLHPEHAPGSSPAPERGNINRRDAKPQR